VALETAGDPMSAQKWVRSSLRTLSTRLTEAGHTVSPPTVGRVLKALDYALHVNAKKVEARSAHPDRDVQFSPSAQQRQEFAAAGRPIVSVDTKKKEPIGAFKNAGRAWSKEAEAVNVQDFPSDAQGRAVPYGIYDVARNRGTVYVGASGDTAQFAARRAGHVVGHPGVPDLPHDHPSAALGRWRGQQRQPHTSVEAATPRTVVRGARADGHGLPRPAGLLEVEPHRASPLRPDQPEWGGPALAHLGDSAGVDPGHHHGHGSGGARGARGGHL